MFQYGKGSTYIYPSLSLGAMVIIGIQTAKGKDDVWIIRILMEET